jgi:hypothetical protein
MHKVWKYTYYSSQESELLGKEHLMWQACGFFYIFGHFYSTIYHAPIT